MVIFALISYRKQSSKLSSKFSPQKGNLRDTSFNLEDSRMNNSGDPRKSSRSNYNSPQSLNKNVNILVTENTPKVTRQQTGKGSVPTISFYDFKGDAITKT